MLNSILNLKKQLSFLSEQTIAKIHTISIDHATLIINEEGLILYLNNQASLLLHISEQSNIFSDTIIASFPSFKTIISKSVGNYKLPLIIDNIEYIVELECITQGDVNAHLCVFYKQTQNTSTSLTYSILLFPSPVLVFSNDYVLETFNNAAFEFFFDRATFEIGEKLLAISPEIHTILSNTTDENKLFKKNQVKFHNQNYLVDFQIISISKHQKLIQFIEIEEVDLSTSEVSIAKKNKAIIEANPDLFFILSKEGYILDAIFSTERELFYKPEFFLNKKITEVLPQNIWDITITSLNNLFQTSENQIFKYEFVVNDKKRYYEARLVIYETDKVLSIIRDITLQEQAEIALQQERNLMQMLLDNSPARIFFKDSEGRFVRVNKAMVKSIGLTSESELIGKTDFDFFAYEHAQKAYKDEQEIIRTGNSHLNTDEQELWIDGRKSWALNSKHPLYDKENNIIGTFGASLDITERKLIEEELRTSEDRYRLFIEHSSDILVYLDENGIQKYISPSAERITGFTIEELKRSFTEVVHPDDVGLVINGFKQLLSEPDKVLKGEYRHKCKDGSFRYMETIGKNYINNPSIKGIVTNVRDITERKIAELALNKQNEEYETLNESLKESNSLIVSINNALMDTIEALNISEQKLKEQNEEYQSLNEDLTASYQRIELINIDLQKAKEKAEESDRLKSDFLANMSHEIRTPMNGLIGFSQMLAEPDITTEKRLFYAKIIEQSCNQLLAIINDIIDISKVESKQMMINKSVVNIRTVLEKYLLFFEPSGVKKGLKIEIAHLPESENEEIFTDEIKLNQILTNLIGNALKFTNSGSITFGCNKREKFIEFYVKDTGIGIETDNFNVIFDRFRQVETGMARSFGGTGLGLAISKAFVELLGGVIWIESVVNQGSTFYFTLPTDENHEKIQL